MEPIAERLAAWARARGYRVAWGPIELATEAKAAVFARACAELDAGFRESWARYLQPPAPAAPEARAIVIIAAPRVAAHVVRFTVDGRPFDAALAFPYPGEDAFRARVVDEVIRLLPGHRIEPLAAPLKPLAARLGLARYGRNNLTYVEGLGSYLQLVGVTIDVALDGARPRPHAGDELLARCAGCDLCRRACPTGAIPADRVLLRGERCIPHLHEQPGDWPAWLPAAAHRCLLGCLACQKACPENRGRFRRVSVEPARDGAETARLLDGPVDPADPIGRRIADKLGQLGIAEYHAVLGRNLRALVARVPDGGPSRPH